MNILVLNAGSSSVKFQLFDFDTQSSLLQGAFENLESEDAFTRAIADAVSACQQYTVDAVGHRVVHGGDTFRDAVIITDDVVQAIGDWAPFAPLHNPRNLAGITACMRELPTVPHVAVFDTAFHASLPRRASTYAIDTAVAQQHKIRRYGFHGTSHQYVAHEAAAFLGRPLEEMRIISLHLGNGASACAIEFGHSTETSMGMTPLEGLVMGSRCGDLDPGVLLTLLRNEVEDVDALDRLLNTQSGLKGLSGISNDLRQLEAEAAQGNDRARLAIAVFAHQARKYIGAYAATMGGVDAIVLTGGIGENSASMRNRILQRLDFIGLSIDEDRNLDAAVDHDHSVVAINDPVSRVKALVVKTNEELMIARQTGNLIEQTRPKPALPPIPIAVSARHLHLDKATFAALFGAAAQPTPYKDLSQPGQYACEECVSLIGPRGRIDRVRLLGPLRSKNQVEISRTDEYLLGVDAPVRDSGQVKNSAPITLEGPGGTVNLDEGLICARRHIHMHTDDALRFGLKNRDEVEVAITGGPRDLVFGDVLVRVSPGYRLEMHIDTDEANAAELDRASAGTLIHNPHSEQARNDDAAVYTSIDNVSAQLRGKNTGRS